MINVAKPTIDKNEIEAAVEVLKTGYYVSGDRVREFEEQFAEYTGVKHAVAVNSGTAALHLALIGLGVGKGDLVITTPLSFFATVEAIMYVGAIPIFVDIDPDTYCITAETVQDMNLDKVKAVIPVHIFGMPCDMKTLMELSYEHDFLVIEDAAQAHGAAINGRKVGSFGHAGCFSFYATKNMTTIEGGMITTDDSDLAKLVKKLRSHGMTDRDTHRYLGFNYRMNELEAAIGIEQLRKLPDMNGRRIEISEDILYALKDVQGLITHLHDLKWEHAYFWCPVLVDEEKLGMSVAEFRHRLFIKGIETRHRYQEPLYRQPVFEKWYGNLYEGLHLENAERICGNVVGLPNRPDMTDDDVQTVIDVVMEVCGC